MKIWYSFGSSSANVLSNTGPAHKRRDRIKSTNAFEVLLTVLGFGNKKTEQAGIDENGSGCREVTALR